MAIALTVLLMSGARTISRAERDVFSLFNSLPGGTAKVLFGALYGVGALWAVGVVALAALAARRWRLSRDLVIAGVAAWGVARLLGVLVIDGTSLPASLRVVTRLGASPSFPTVHIAVLAGVVSAAAPYVSRPTRWVARAIVLVSVPAGMHLGTAYPRAALAGLAVGWGVAAAVHLALKSPAGRPTTLQVAAALRDLGVDAHGLRLRSRQPWGAVVMDGHDEDGPLEVRVLGRDQTDGQLLARLARSAFYKDAGPWLRLTRAHQVEREAYDLLLAREGGARTARVVVAGTGAQNVALLAVRPLTGRLLADVRTDEVTDDLLAGVWEQARRLQRSRVVHGRLNASHVVLTAGGPGLAGFWSAPRAPWAHSASDIAELLVSTAAIVGPHRAVAVAHRSLGTERLRSVLSLIQPAAVLPETRALVRERQGGVRRPLEALRDAAAAELGVPPPALQPLHPVRASSLVFAVGTFAAVALLLRQLGNPARFTATLSGAQWGWIAVAVALSLATNVPFAVALMGTVRRRLPLWRSVEVEVGMSFSNLAIPAVGGTAMQVRYLQKQGVGLASAVAAGGLLSTVANVAAQVPLLVLAVLVAPRSVDLSQIPTQGVLAVVLGLILLTAGATAVVVGIPRLRHAFLPHVKAAAEDLWRVTTSPRRVLMMLAGDAGAALLYALCLEACLAAFGQRPPMMTVLGINIAVGTLASLVPIPGGGTAVASIGMAGALVAVGVPRDAAVAGVLANQLVVSYLPALPGWVATRTLIHRDLL